MNANSLLSTGWSTDVKIGFIGLGNIGGGAAANLSRAGYEVRVFDLDPEKVASLIALGASAATSVSDAARDADVVFTSLPGPMQIRAIGLGSDHEPGIIEVLSPGATWIELSTNDHDTAALLLSAAEAAEVALIDAPVSGGPEGADAGTLSVFAGGHERDIERVWPLLCVIGSTVTHVGAHGAGITAKIAQVTLCYTQTVALIEALLLGVKGGVEPATMLRLIQNSAGGSYVANTYGPEILAGTYDTSFPSVVCDLYARTEDTYGSAAPHLLAAQLLERANNLVLHEQKVTTS